MHVQDHSAFMKRAHLNSSEKERIMERAHNGMKIAYKQMKRAHKQMKGARKDDCGTNLFCTEVSDGFP